MTCAPAEESEQREQPCAGQNLHKGNYGRSRLRPTRSPDLGRPQRSRGRRFPPRRPAGRHAALAAAGDVGGAAGPWGADSRAAPRGRPPATSAAQLRFLATSATVRARAAMRPTTAIMPSVLPGCVRAPRLTHRAQGEACVTLQPVQMPFEARDRCDRRAGHRHELGQRQRQLPADPVPQRPDRVGRPGARDGPPRAASCTKPGATHSGREELRPLRGLLPAHPLSGSGSAKRSGRGPDSPSTPTWRSRPTVVSVDAGFVASPVAPR